MPESATEYYKKVASHLFSSLGWPCGYRIVFLGRFLGSFFGVFFWGIFFLGGGNFGRFFGRVALFRYRSIRALAPAMCSFHCAHTPPQVGYVLVSLRAYAAHRSRGGVLPFEDRNCRPISFGAKSFDRRFAKL